MQRLEKVYVMNVEFDDISKASKKIIELVRNWRNSEIVRKYMINTHFITKNEHKKWISTLKKDNNAKAWVINYNKKPVGLAYLTNIEYKNKTTDWGLYIADDTMRGKGIGSVALYKLMEYVFDEMNFNEMHTKVLENNPKAMKLYEKFGFKIKEKLEKKLVRDRKHINVILFGISKKDWENTKKLHIEN